LIEIGFNWNRNKVLEMVLEATGYAKAHGLRTTFFAVDSARADPKFLRTLYTSAIGQSHVDSVAVVDTFGVTSPDGFAQLVRAVKKYVRVPIEVHCHNDFGLGTANAIAGLSAGASVAHTNVNGIGERAGGASTEEVAVALRILYGKDLGFNFGKLYELSQFVQKVSGVPVSPQKPVVGDTAFGYEAGIAAMFSYRFAHAKSLRYGLPYLPELVGNKFSITLGKKSGSMSIRWRLEELHYEASDEQVDRILARVKETGVRLRRGLTDAEFVSIVKEVLASEAPAKPT
jgi:methanogen homocitrate synthase